MELSIRGKTINSEGKTIWYDVDGVERYFIERKLRKMPRQEWQEFLRKNGYSLPKEKLSLDLQDMACEG